MTKTVTASQVVRAHRTLDSRISAPYCCWRHERRRAGRVRRAKRKTQRLMFEYLTAPTGLDGGLDSMFRTEMQKDRTMP